MGVLTGWEVSPGAFLHDTDIDWAPGIPIAEALLPESGFVFGHAPTKPISHSFVLFPEALLSIEYHDISKTRGGRGPMFIELRGTKQDGSIGKQSMVPPSIWTDKDQGKREPLTFHRSKMPTLFPDVARYKQLLLCTAIGMILAKHLGKNGFGHDVRLAWAGFLLRAGFDIDDLIHMGEGMSVPCTNQEVDDVRTVVESTKKALASGSKRVKGGRTLAKILGADGPAVIDRINEWLGKEQRFHSPQRHHCQRQSGKPSARAHDAGVRAVVQRVR